VSGVTAPGKPEIEQALLLRSGMPGE